MDGSYDASSSASMVSSSSSFHRYPNWVMLDPHTRLNYPTPTLDYPEEEEHFRATHAYAETSKGDPIRVSFRAVPPPGNSRLYVRWTPRAKLSSSSSSSSSWSYGREPKVVAAHRNSIIVQNRSEFFVYTVHSVEQSPPTLLRLPRCDLQFAEVHPRSPGPGLHYMSSPSGVGLLSNCDRDEFVVADLRILRKEYCTAAAASSRDDDDTLKEDGISASRDDDDDTPVEAGLCRFRSYRPGDGWKATRPRIRHDSGQGVELIWWSTDVVVPFGDYLCYVDYLRGVLFMDILSECPELRYVHLPVTIPAGDPTHHGLRGCGDKSRSVCVTDGGDTMKFVEVVTTTVHVSFIPEPVSSSYIINMWKLRPDSIVESLESTSSRFEPQLR